MFTTSGESIMRMRMHSKSGIVNGLFPDRNRLVVKKIYPCCLVATICQSYPQFENCSNPKIPYCSALNANLFIRNLVESQALV